MNGPPRSPADHAASSVADEAMRLVEALAGLASGIASTPADQPGVPSVTDPAVDERPADEIPDRDQPDQDPPTATGSPAPSGCACTDSSAAEAICRVCPVCRLAGLLAAIRPETLERCADLLGMVAGSLQAVATDRRGAPAGDPPASGARHPGADAAGAGRTPPPAAEADRDEVVPVVDDRAEHGER